MLFLSLLIICIVFSSSYSVVLVYFSFASSVSCPVFPFLPCRLSFPGCLLKLDHCRACVTPCVYAWWSCLATAALLCSPSALTLLLSGQLSSLVGLCSYYLSLLVFVPYPSPPVFMPHTCLLFGLCSLLFLPPLVLSASLPNKCVNTLCIFFLPPDPWQNKLANIGLCSRNIKILLPSNARERLAHHRVLANFHMGYRSICFFTSLFFLVMSMGPDYDNTTIKDIFSACLDDPLPKWEMDGLKI